LHGRISVGEKRTEKLPEVHTVNILGLAAIVFIHGRNPFSETIKLAEELNILILTNKIYPLSNRYKFTLLRIAGSIEKVGENKP